MGHLEPDKRTMSEQDEPRRDLILCVDDEQWVLSVLREQLDTHFGDDWDVAVAGSAEEALSFIHELKGNGNGNSRLAMLIADEMMPGMKGSELLGEVHSHHPHAIKVLLTGQAGLDAVVRAVNRGGLDFYIAKPWNETELKLTVDSLLKQYRLEMENNRLIKELSDKNEELRRFNMKLKEMVDQRTQELVDINSRLEQLAITDGLTGLFNHRHFRQCLGIEVQRAHRSGESLSLLMVDVDQFKKYNDTNGHLGGDEALKGIASILSKGRRVSDMVARYGGEEFALVLVGADVASGKMVAEYLRRRVERTSFPGEEAQPGGRLTISVGVATYPAHASDATGLIQASDDALYRAKQLGRNQVVVATKREPLPPDPFKRDPDSDQT